MKIYVFHLYIIATLFFSHTHAMQKTCSFTFWLRFYTELAQRKRLEKPKDQTIAEKLTPEGLAYILMCFPREMQQKIAGYLPISDHNLVPYILQHLQPQKLYSNFFPDQPHSIDQVQWFEKPEIVHVVLATSSGQKKHLTFYLAGHHYICGGAVAIPKSDPNNSDYKIASHIHNPSTVRRCIRNGKNLITLYAEPYTNRDQKKLILFKVAKIDTSPLFAFSEHIKNAPPSQHLLLEEKIVWLSHILKPTLFDDEQEKKSIAEAQLKLTELASTFVWPAQMTAAAASKSDESDQN